MFLSYDTKESNSLYFLSQKSAENIGCKGGEHWTRKEAIWLTIRFLQDLPCLSVLYDNMNE